MKLIYGRSLGTRVKKVFLVEDFFRNSDTIEKIIHQFPTDVVISTSRTSVFDLRNEKVLNVLGSDYKEFDINRLEQGDIEQLIAIVDENGLWGEFSDGIMCRKLSS